MKVALNYIIGIILLVSLILNGILVYKLKQPSAPDVIEIVQKDTVTITKDSIITEIKWKTKFDTIREIQYIDTLNGDTLKIQDTLEIPIDYKVDSFTLNKDSLQFNQKIHYHGYKAEIDSVEFAYQLHYTQEVPKPKQKKIGFVWFIGPSASGGINFNINNRTFDYGPSLGISVGVGIGGCIETK